MKPKPHIVSHKDGEFKHTATMIGGELDGMEFRSVLVLLSDGTISTAYICNSQPGYYTPVFVPWGSEVTMQIE